MHKLHIYQLCKEISAPALDVGHLVQIKAGEDGLRKAVPFQPGHQAGQALVNDSHLIKYRSNKFQ